MAFNFLNHICSQQEEGNGFDNESDIDIEEEDSDFRPDLHLGLDSNNEDQNIDLESESDDGVEFPWSATLNDVQVQLFTS